MQIVPILQELCGGTGADQFVFRTGDVGQDHIADFNRSEGEVWAKKVSFTQRSRLAIQGRGWNYSSSASVAVSTGSKSRKQLHEN